MTYNVFGGTLNPTLLVSVELEAVSWHPTADVCNAILQSISNVKFEYVVVCCHKQMCANLLNV